MRYTEERLAAIEAIIPTLATKEDLATAKFDIIKWVAVMQIATLAATLGAVAAIVRFLG